MNKSVQEVPLSDRNRFTVAIIVGLMTLLTLGICVFAAYPLATLLGISSEPAYSIFKNTCSGIGVLAGAILGLKTSRSKRTSGR